jgi:hypothetical protein
VRFLGRTCRAGAATLSIDSPAFSERLAVDAPGTPFAKTLPIPPGGLVIHFDCNAQPFIDPARTIVFGLYNFQLQEIDAAQEPVHVAQSTK